eukprot:PRCOL_00006585-RA
MPPSKSALARAEKRAAREAERAAKKAAAADEAEPAAADVAAEGVAALSVEGAVEAADGDAGAAKPEKKKRESRFGKKGKKAKEDAARAEAERAAAEAAAKANAKGDRGGREHLGFFERTGPNAPRRRNLNMDIHIENITLAAGNAELISNGVLRLVYGVHYGLVGRNGVGKSTLLRAITSGEVQMPDFLFTIHVEQEIQGDDRTVLQTILQVDKEREWLLAKEEELCAMDDEEAERYVADGGVDLNEVYERLDELDSDSAESRAAAILAGLGFDHEAQNRPTREFSGGWRMRIALAQALFLKPDLLLLDEPTNHLDVFALTWLEEFLSTWERTIVIVSHDRGFLNTVTNATAHLHRKRLWYYGGNYDTFIKVRAEHRANQMSTHKDQTARADQLKRFIAKFGQGHKKMVKQAQCRMKKLDKLKEEMVTVDWDDASLKINFPAATPLPPPCVSVVDTAFGYEPGKTLYENLNFGLDCDSRVAIVGPNGAGKSTFLKLVMGEIIPTEGWVNRHCKLRLAMFSQHSVEKMDVEADAVTHMRRLDEDMPLEEARAFLGRFGLSGQLATNPIKNLSGGQKSRLAFAELAWRLPHILLLDEPTNHLDLETIESLAMAINAFEGGVVLVSHDERLISLTCDELWCVHKGQGGKPGSVFVYDGDFDSYREMLKNDFKEQALLKSGKSKKKGGKEAEVAKAGKQPEVTKAAPGAKPVMVPPRPGAARPAAPAPAPAASAGPAGGGGGGSWSAARGDGGGSGGSNGWRGGGDSRGAPSRPAAEPARPNNGYVALGRGTSKGGGGGWGGGGGGGAGAADDAWDDEPAALAPAPAPRGSYVPPHLRNRQ